MGEIEVSTTGDCNSFITERILLPATLSIVSNSCADFSALVIFFCCTASTAVTGGGSFDVSGRIWNGGVDGGGGGVSEEEDDEGKCGNSPSFKSVSSSVSSSFDDDDGVEIGEKELKLNSDDKFDGGAAGGGADGADDGPG